MRRLLSAALLLLAPLAARAQHSGNGYLFGPPEARVVVRGGWAAATAGSDLFDFTVDQLTLNRRDFSGVTLGGAVGIPLGERFELGADVGYSFSRHGSEFRKFVDNDDRPIEQTTTFQRVPMLLTARANLAPSGRAVGRLAWVPASIVPYVGVGAGVTWYQFRQEGDFVDYQTSNVFPDDLKSSGVAATVMGNAGLDYSLTPRLALTGDARYLWARGALSRDFSGFDKLDLSGLSATVGLTVRL